MPALFSRTDHPNPLCPFTYFLHRVHKCINTLERNPCLETLPLCWNPASFQSAGGLRCCNAPWQSPTTPYKSSLKSQMPSHSLWPDLYRGDSWCSLGRTFPTPSVLWGHGTPNSLLASPFLWLLAITALSWSFYSPSLPSLLYPPNHLTFPAASPKVCKSIFSSIFNNFTIVNFYFC